MAKEIVRNLLVVFLLVLVMFISLDQSRAATLDLTIPPGDYILVPVQPYTVVTIQSTPVDPPVLDTDGDGVTDDIDQCQTVAGAPPDGCPIQPPGGYTYLDPLVPGIKDQAETYYMPAYDSPADGWAMITAMCGDVGQWQHEIVVSHDQTEGVSVKNLDGCVHIKGIPGPNGELPEIDIGSTRGYYGDLSDGGLFVENIKTDSIGVPNSQYFFVLHNVHLSNWADHAFITSGGNRHMYVEVLDSYAGHGNNNHAFYVDNVAYLNFQRNVCESPGRQHCLRSIAAKSIIKDNTICNINCDGTISQTDSGRELIGSPPLDVYVNGEHLIENNRIVYYRESNGAEMAANFRSRPHIWSLDRYREGDHYAPLVWGTDTFNDPATWEAMPMLETIVRDMQIECLGEPPCTAWSIVSTYPKAPSQEKDRLAQWWAENSPPDWETLLANVDPSWHATLDLMDPLYRERAMERDGAGMPHSIPVAIPEGWQQKAKITFENVTGNFTQLIRHNDYDPNLDTGNWCWGKREGDLCIDQEYYQHPLAYLKEVDNITLIAGETNPGEIDPPTEPVGDWRDAIIPYIPSVGEIRFIPGTSITPYLHQDDGTAACQHLRCSRSVIALYDWVGMAFDQVRGIFRLVAPGGHGDLGTNSVYEFDIGSLQWSRVFDYAPPKAPFPDLVDADGNGVLDCAELEQGPMGVHSYDTVVYVPSRQVTALLKSINYDPRSPKCERVDRVDEVAIWRDAGGYEFVGIPTFGAGSAAYDDDRDVIYGVDPSVSRFVEIDPLNWTIREIDYVYGANSGGVMAMEGRYVYWSNGPIGLSRRHVSVDGEFGPIEQLVDGTDWPYSHGVAVSEGIVVGWDGRNGMRHYDTHTGELRVFEAYGDDMSLDPYHPERVFGKWYAVMPGVFMGISGNDGFVLYRAF